MTTTYSIRAIASILNNTDPPNTGEGFVNILLTDSRKLIDPPNTLFFALKGPQRDGHLFIKELYSRGVRFFVVSEPQDPLLYPGAVFFKVGDTLDALQRLAAFHRRRFQLEVVGITGSNGKTIVKEWLFQLLHAVKNMVRSPKSYNSQIGVPLSIWQVSADNDLAVIEAGISRPGEMEKLQQVIKPTIGVITNIGLAHSEGFKDDTEKLKEKLVLFKEADLVIANGDNTLIRSGVERLKARRYFWGRNGENDLQLVKTLSAAGNTSLSFKEGALQFDVQIPFTDNASIENAVTCIAVLRNLGIEVSRIADLVKGLQPIDMRMTFKQGINNCTVINDSYSADLTSLSVALEFLSSQSKGKRKCIILSDFLENDANEQKLYRSILDLANQFEVERFIGIGEKMIAWMPELVAKAAVQPELQLYLTTKDYLQQFHSTAYRDEYILVKGARRFGFERIVARLEQKVHETVLEINLDAVASNLKAFQQLLHPGVKLMAMVKAFGYGSGAAEIAGVMQFHKADYLGVAYADEGVELRKAGITMPVMVLNVEASAFDAITDYNLEPDLFSFELLTAFEQHLISQGLHHYPVHIEIETGMNRSGFPVSDIGALGAYLKNNAHITVRSCFSHLAASEDVVEDMFTLRQFELLKKAAGQLEAILGYPFIKHIANTSAIQRFPQLQLDMVRLGIGLYGVSGNGNLQLQPAATLKTTVSQIRKIKKGETVSYNRRGIARKDSVIATIRIGYADGYNRRLGNGAGKVWINGQLAPVIGTVCMDMTMIDVTDVPDVREGDDVIVFGEAVTVQQIADWTGTIPYEVMTGISQRVKRIYYGEG